MNGMEATLSKSEVGYECSEEKLKGAHIAGIPTQPKLAVLDCIYQECAADWCRY